MGRPPRIIVPGMPHHVTHRGNRGADIFVDDDDRRVYLSLLLRHSENCGVTFWAYCLMINHVHLIAIPVAEKSLPRLIQTAHKSYADYFNRRYDGHGHLWRIRYHSCVMDETHLWAAVRYVERNPVRAGIVRRAEHHPWSSAAVHCGLVSRDPLVERDFPIPAAVADWSAWLADEDTAFVTSLRDHTRTGLPSGAAAFTHTLSRTLGRPLQHTRVRHSHD